MRRLKIIIADDHRLMLSALRLTFDADAGFEVVGEANDGSEVLPLVGRTHPDVVLLDLKMPRMDGLACLEHMRRRFPEVRTVILSGFDDGEIVQSAFRHGATAFILKRIDPVDLPAAIRQAVEGTVSQTFAAGDEAASLKPRASGVTERELEILVLVAEGKSNKQIASELYLAVQTVKFHLTSLYRKLDSSTRTEAVREGYRRGLLESPLFERVG
jgi:NarL family two-component system response regulator LiaR